MIVLLANKLTSTVSEDLLYERYTIQAGTSDLDFIACVPTDVGGHLKEVAGEGSSLFEKYKLYFDPVPFANLPENYEERLEEIFPGRFNHLRLWALDPYDLALSKLERAGTHDVEDVLYLARTLPFDLNLFRERYEKEFKIYVEDNIRHRGTFDHWIRIITEERES